MQISRNSIFSVQISLLSVMMANAVGDFTPHFSTLTCAAAIDAMPQNIAAAINCLIRIFLIILYPSLNYSCQATYLK